MGQLGWTRPNGGFRIRLLSGQPSLRHVFSFLALTIVLFVAFGVLSFNTTFTETVHGLFPFLRKVKVPHLILEPAGTGFYDWETSSAFQGVSRDAVEGNSLEELCAAFPTHLLDEIQPVLKTGHRVS